MKTHRNKGFSLAEVLIAMFLLTVMSLFLARMLLAGVQMNHISNDEIRLNAIVNDRMEQLLNMSFNDLGMPCLNDSQSCGDLDSNYVDTSVTPNVKYFDDSIPGYTVRWTISLPTGSRNFRRATVRAISNRNTAVGEDRDLKIYYDRSRY